MPGPSMDNAVPGVFDVLYELDLHGSLATDKLCDKCAMIPGTTPRLVTASRE